MVVFLNPDMTGATFASVVYDFEHWKLPTEKIIESGCDTIDGMTQIVLSAMENFPQAKTRYHEVFKPKFWDFLLFFDRRSVRGMLGIVGTCRRFQERNHFGPLALFDFKRLFHVLRGPVFGVWRVFSGMAKKTKRES